RGFKPLGHIGKVLVATSRAFTACGDRGRRRGWRGRLRGPARFQPRLCALFLARFLASFLALILSLRLADIAAIALRRGGSRGKLVGERGQGGGVTGARRLEPQAGRRVRTPAPPPAPP